MKVLLIRDQSVSEEFISEVHALLVKVEGAVQFRIAPTPLDTGSSKILSWKELFHGLGNYCGNQFSDDFCFLLTKKNNEKGFFGFINPANKSQGFVHAGDWHRYLNCPEEIPTAYHIIALILQKHIFPDLASLQENLHKSPIGCINDFCQNKKEVILKLRTGDLCPTCMEKLLPSLALPILHQFLEILESLRLRMLFAQNMKQFLKPSRLELTNNYNLRFPDFANLEIRLRPLEKVVYTLFYRYPEGLPLNQLTDYKEEMKQIYQEVSGLASYSEMNAHIEDLCNVLHNSCSEKISRIKRLLQDQLGKQLSTFYAISGKNSEPKKIPILSHEISN